MHLISGHHIPEHWGQEDEVQLRRIRPRSSKIIEHFREGYAPTRTLQVHAASPNTLLVLRDHPLSEQYDDVWKDPEGTGRRHADEWARKIQSWQSDQRWKAIPVEQVVVLGINEFPAWDDRGGPNYGKPNAVGVSFNDRYNAAFLRRLSQHGIRGGGGNINTGWPANWGTDLPPVWDGYAGMFQAIAEGHHFYVGHEYWPKEGPQKHWGWLAGRTLTCPYNVPVIIGECGLEQRVVEDLPDPSKWGWQAYLSPAQYVVQLLDYNARMMADPRIHSLQIFTWDFSHPFGSTDVRPCLHRWPENDAWDNMVNSEIETLPPVIEIPTEFAERLLAEAERQQVIQFNPDAALQKKIFVDGFVPNSEEFQFEGNIAQRAEHMGTGEVRAYFVPIGQWDKVQYVVRG